MLFFMLFFWWLHIKHTDMRVVLLFSSAVTLSMLNCCLKEDARETNLLDSSSMCADALHGKWVTGAGFDR